MAHKTHKPKLGIQGPVVAWQDAWAGEASDLIMRTGTGSVCPSQDPKPEPAAFVNSLRELHTDFYVHHVLPGVELGEVVADITAAGMDICLGNEYGNINGPWVEGTNRYDVPDEAVTETSASGRCIGLLYDEPEHLQINAGQYRKDGWFPHWGGTDGLDIAQARNKVEQSVRTRVEHVQQLAERAGINGASVPLITEQVFPTMFHTFARAGMDLCPKIMKESFQSLQLSTALGAAKQYGRALWICADLWGPDTGTWFTRFPGFPGHSPQEFESALKLGYYMGPTHLFVENIDVLLQHGPEGFAKTEFGEVWQQFVRKFIPEHGLTWDHTQASPDIAVIHSDDGNYGQNERLFGNRTLHSQQAHTQARSQEITRSQSVFHIWHLLSRGTIPAHGSCMHIPGYDFPRHQLKQEVPLDRFPLEHGFTGAGGRRVHPLFYGLNNVLAFDDQVTSEQLGQPKLIVVGGATLSTGTFGSLIRKAEDGAVVVIADWLLPADCPGRLKASGKMGFGRWIVTSDFLGSEAREAVHPFLGEKRVWTQRFGSAEVRIYPQDEEGFTLDFDIVKV